MKKDTFKLILISISSIFLSSCGGGGSTQTGADNTSTVENQPSSSVFEEAGYFSSQPFFSITVTDPNACWTQFITPVDMDGDGKKDLAMHFWCNQFNVPIGFNGPTPDVFKVYLNKGTKFENGTLQLFGTQNVYLGGATRKLVLADFNNDGKTDLAYATNREDGRPIGDNLNVAATQATIITSTKGGGYTVDRIGEEVWYHAVDSYQINQNKKAVVYHRMGALIPVPQVFSKVDNNWVLENEVLPPLNGLTYRFLKSNPLLESDDLVITVGQNDATELDIYKKTISGWQKGAGYSPSIAKNVVPTIGWNGDKFLGNRMEINGASYTGAGFDDSCLIKRTPSAPAMFVGKFSGRRLPDGYKGETVKEMDLRLEYQLIAFEASNGNLKKVDLALNTPLEPDFFNFIECTDINNDGYDDIVISFQRSGGLPAVYINNKSGGFNKVQSNIYPTVNTANGDSRGTLSDLDGDGIAELIIFNLSTSPKTIKIYKGIKKIIN